MDLLFLFNKNLKIISFFMRKSILKLQKVDKLISIKIPLRLLSLTMHNVDNHNFHLNYKQQKSLTLSKTAPARLNSVII